MKLKFSLLVTGSPHGSQQSSSAYLFAKALLEKNHDISCIFFFQDGTLNANKFNSPLGGQFDLVNAWRIMGKEENVPLKICISSGMRRGVIDYNEANLLGFSSPTIAEGFEYSSLGFLSEQIMKCDRWVQF